MYSYTNYQKAKDIIEERRLNAIATADRRNEEVRERSSKITEIDRELTGTGLLLFKTACGGGDIEEIKKRNIALMAERRAALVELGLPEDYTDLKYTCPICKEHGVDVMVAGSAYFNAPDHTAFVKYVQQPILINEDY